MKIRDYACSKNEPTTIDEKVASQLNLTFPDCYKNRHTMAKIAEVISNRNKALICSLPFCHTVELEAFGGRVNFGDAVTCPRPEGCILNNLEEVLLLEKIDFDTGRIHELLEAVEILKKSGKNVTVEVSGSLTILNGLIDLSEFFKAMRKKPDLMKKIYEFLGVNLKNYILRAVNYGAEVISFADSTAAVSILGPKWLRFM